MTRGKSILVLGGGIGGLVAANELRRQLDRTHKISVVEKNHLHCFPPSFLWLMTGDRQPHQICRPVRALLRSGIELVQAEVLEIDFSKRTVRTTHSTLSFDYLVIALGADLAPERIPGLTETSYSFYTFEDTVKLQAALAQFEGGNISLVVGGTPYKCPGAPHEAVMLIADFFKRRGIRQKTDIHLYTPESQPMPVAGPQLGDAVKDLLRSKGISFHPGHKLTSIRPDTQELLFEGQESARYDLVIAIPPHRSPLVAREAGLTNESGWIPVSQSTLRTRIENVYAIGDITSIVIPGQWRADTPMVLPKAGVFAHTQAEIVAQRIAAEINGRKSMHEFSGTGYCMLEAGEGLATFAYGDFFGVPVPRLELRKVGRTWHLGKILMEQWWLASFGIKKAVLQSFIKVGSKMLGIPVKV